LKFAFSETYFTISLDQVLTVIPVAVLLDKDQLQLRNYTDLYVKASVRTMVHKKLQQ